MRRHGLSGHRQRFVPSLVFAGKPRSPHCYGESLLALLDKDHDLDVAAQALGFNNAEALQYAVHRYCRSFVY